MLPPKRFKQNTTKATEIKRNGTEAIGIDQDGIAKSIDIEVLMNKGNVGLGKVVNKTETELVASGAIADALALKFDKSSLADNYDGGSTKALSAEKGKDLNARVSDTDDAISAIKGAGWTDENLVDHDDRLDTLEADDTTEGSIAYDIKQSSDALKGVGYTEGSLKTHEGRLDTLEADDTVVGSVVKSIKDEAENATFTPTVGSGIASVTIENAVNEVGTELSTVKVKTTENDLAIADIRRDQTLANQSEAKISVADYGIVALPKNATGNLKMKREGLTARQLCLTGDFATSVGWTPNSSTISVASNILTSTGIIGTEPDIRYSNLISSTAGDKIYISVRRRVTNADCTSLGIYLHNGATFVIGLPGISNPVQNQWYTFTTVYTTLIDFTDLRLRIRHEYTNSIGKTMEIDGEYGVKIINLTQTFGAGNEPTAGQCLNIFPTYFADTKNVPMTGRYRGRGKNLLSNDPSDWEQGILDSTTGEAIFSNTYLRSKNFILIQANTTLKFSIGAGFALNNIWLYDYGKNFTGKTDSSLIATSTQIRYAKVAIQKTILATIFSSDIILTQAMLKLGSTDTTYAPYEAHDLYLTAPEGRSVPSAKDSIEVQDGKLVHVKRVSDSVAVSSGVAVNVTNYPLAKTGGNFRVELTAGGVQIGVIGTDSTSGAGTLTYVLTTEVKTNIDQDGSIPAGASVLWEPAIPDVGIYSTKFDILDTTHPIASIDKLYKVDFATGVQTLLTDAVIAGDGLSFTSASLADGDLVNVIYFYSVANPEGLTTVTYLNSILVSIDTVTGTGYMLKPVFTNGVLQPITSWTVTEVV